MACRTITLSDAGLPRGDRLWSALRRGKLGPMLYASRLRVGDAAPPDPWRRSFRQDYFTSLVSHHAYCAATSRILQEASARGLPALILRGTSVAEGLYDDPALRPYTDIDLLIPRARLAEAKELARELGYEAPNGSLPDSFFERHHLQLRFVAPDTGVPLELHWALDHPFTLYRVDYDSLVANALTGPIGGAEALRPTAEDRLIILALHLSKHASALQFLPADELPAHALERNLLLWMVDIYRLVDATDDPLDWDEVVRRAESWEVSGPVGTALQAVAQVLKAPIPAAPLAALVRAGGRPAILERGLARVFVGNGVGSRGLRRLSSRVVSSPALFNLERISGVGSFVFPSAGWVRRHGPWPGGPLPLRRVLQSGRSAMQLSRFFWDLGTRSAAAASRRFTGRSPAPAARRTPVQG
jgi:hypothetical protein